MKTDKLGRNGLVALSIAVAGTLTLGVAAGMGASPTTDYMTNFTRFESPNPQLSGRWAERLATVPDLNGDGKNELLLADLAEDFGGFTNAGRVYMQDGATRSLLYNITSPQIQANAFFGFYISVIGDVNGDGKADFAAGTDAQDTEANGNPCTAPASGPLGTCNQDQGKAWVFSGANGQTLYALNNPNPQGFARFGSRIGRAGDINGDGFADVIVGASNNDVPAGCGNDPATGRPLAAAAVPAGCRVNEGEAFIFSGKDGASLRTLNVPVSDRAPAPCGGTSAPFPCGGFGLAVQGPGDVNGDAIVDQLVNASSFNFDTLTNGPCATPLAPTCRTGQGAQYLFSGKDGTLIRRTDDPVPQAGATWGFQDVEPLAPGDVDGDGAADYYANGFSQHGPNGETSGGRAWVFSGKTGAVLFELKDPTPQNGGQFGWSMAKTDYNKDGTPDLYVGQSPHHTSGAGINQAGGTYVFNGKDGTILKSLELPASDAQPGVPGGNLGSNLGWGLAAPGDLNGDGEPDYAASGPFTDVGPSAFNCQSPTPECIQDAGREFFFYSNAPAVGGGGGQTTGGGGQTTPVSVGGRARDVVPPLVTLLGKSSQSVTQGSVNVVVLSNEDARLTATATAYRPALRSTSKASAAAKGVKKRIYGLRSAAATAKAGKRVTLKLRLTKKAVKGIRQGLKRGRRTTVRVRIVAVDAAGNKRAVKRQIRVKD